MDEQQTAAIPSALPGSGKPVDGHGSRLIFNRLRRPIPPPSPLRQNLILGTLMLTMVLLGWNNGSLGPLLPFLQDYYNINFLIMSLVWVTNFAGTVVSGFTYLYITDRIGFGLAAPLGGLAQCIAFAMMSSGGPYGVFLTGSAVIGFGFGLQDAQVNNITSRLPNASTKVFVVQACFGLGGTIAPFIATAFAQQLPTRAYLYFLVAMGVALLTMFVMIITIQGRTEQQIVGRLDTEETPMAALKASNDVQQRSTYMNGVVNGNEPDSEAMDGANSRNEKISETLPIPPLVPTDVAPPGAERSSWDKMRLMFRRRATWALLIYSFVYVGAEITLSGYITSFLVDARGGDAASGYATTGYWGGITIGRLALIPLTHKMGYQVSIYLYSIIALGLNIVVWFTHNLVGNAVTFALVGLFLGPIYPAVLMVVAEVLDDELRGGVMGLMGATGGAGAAAWPFVTGALSDRFGIWILQPLVVALIGVDILLWIMVPRHRVTCR